MMTVSLIDYIGKMTSKNCDDGVGIILSLLLNDKTYEMIYWINVNNHFLIKIENSFYIDYPNINDIQDYKYIIDLINYIDNVVLPPKEEIFKEFLN